MQIHQAVVAKLTVKKIHSIVDHVQIIMTQHMGTNPALLVMQDWLEEARLHLRKLEHSVEAVAE